MRFIAALALIVSASSFASDMGTKKVSFSVGGRSGFDHTYYNCDSVRSSVENLIEKLGGMNVRVSCTGGLDTWGHMPPMPAYVTASFENSSNGTGAVEEVTVKGGFQSDCNLNVPAMEAILPAFENITVVNKRASCMRNDSRWYYTLNIVR